MEAEALVHGSNCSRRVDWRAVH